MNIYNTPWYGFEGPTQSFLINDFLLYFKTNNRVYKYHSSMFSDIIKNLGKWKKRDCFKNNNNIVIDNSLIIDIISNHFKNINAEIMSWRGYFNFKECVFEIKMNEILKEMNILYAIQILNDKFLVWVNHWLYKPNGIRWKKIKETTKVGNNF